MARAVVDQPGLKVILFGLIISLFIGLSVKSQISPHKTKKKIDQALVRLQPDLKINFASAQIKLSDWGWPWPYVVINKIAIEPTQAICDDSQIYVESLSFPISWNLLISKNKKISSIRLSHVELRLGNIEKCFVSQSTQLESSATEKSDLFSTKTSAELQDVKIDRIKIISKSNYNYPIDLQSSVFKFEYDKNYLTKIYLSSQIFGFKDSLKNFYKLKSDLDLQIYKENKKLIFYGEVNGKMLNKDYKVQFNYNNQDQKMALDFNLDNVSVKSLLNILEDLNPTMATFKDQFSGYTIGFSGKGTWLSEQLQLELNQLNIKSENINFLSEKVDFNSNRNTQAQLATIKVQAKMENIKIDLIPNENRAAETFLLMAGDLELVLNSARAEKNQYLLQANFYKDDSLQDSYRISKADGEEIGLFDFKVLKRNSVLKAHQLRLNFKDGTYLTQGAPSK